MPWNRHEAYSGTSGHVAVPLHPHRVGLHCLRSPLRLVYASADFAFVMRTVLSEGLVVLHLGQALYCRMWWLLFTAVLCGIGEIIGWSARLSSSIDIVPFNPFLIQ